MVHGVGLHLVSGCHGSIAHTRAGSIVGYSMAGGDFVVGLILGMWLRCMHELFRIVLAVFVRCSQWTLPLLGAFFAHVPGGFDSVCSHTLVGFNKLV